MTTVQVVIDSKTRALDSTYSYRVPCELLNDVSVGCAVSIQFGARQVVGFVVRVETDDQIELSDNDKLKEIDEVLSESYFDARTSELMLWIAHYYICPLSCALRLAIPIDGAPKVIYKRDGTFEIKKPRTRPKQFKFKESEVTSLQSSYAKPKALSHEQNVALNRVIESYEADEPKCVLVDGVTGSGKTEVYLQSIEHVLQSGKNAIVLVPEIVLTPQTVARFRSRFGDAVAVLHSRMTPAERRGQFWWIKEGNARVVIGPRSALFAPLSNVGIIVIDEEHEGSYKQESAPRYHARTVAQKMIESSGGVLVAGSATPTLETLHLAKHDVRWDRVELTARATGARLPDIEIVDMTEQKGSKKNSLFSQKLKSSIQRELTTGNKIVLLLNRRGYSSFILCHDCGFVPECPNCSTSLSFHERERCLMCHHCGYSVVSPHICPSCGSVYIKRLGAGTQKVEAEVRDIVRSIDGSQDIKIIRMDSDTTKSRDAHEKLLVEFADAKRAILLGTQMIAKGLDFEEVTLVGVINADVTMHLPDFRAAERTYALIEQVSGRCGRNMRPGRVIVQTSQADNPALRAAQTHDREMFLRVELPKRSILKYPPYVKLARILVWSQNEVKVSSEAKKIYDQLMSALAGEVSKGVELSCANPAPFERIAKNYRWHILIKVPLDVDISSKLEPFFRKYRSDKEVNVCVDIEPMQIL